MAGDLYDSPREGIGEGEEEAEEEEENFG